MCVFYLVFFITVLVTCACTSRNLCALHVCRCPWGPENGGYEVPGGCKSRKQAVTLSILCLFHFPVCVCFCFRPRASLCSPGWPGTCFADQADHEVSLSCLSLCFVGIRVCTFRDAFWNYVFRLLYWVLPSLPTLGKRERLERKEGIGLLQATK